jgi:hypothetical protein
MVYECAQKAKAIIVDGDDTLWKHRVALAIGKGYLKSEALNLHLFTVFRGINGSMKVNDIVKKGGENGEVLGLQHLYKVLSDNNLGTVARMHDLAGWHIDKNRIKSVVDLLEKRGDETPVILVSLGGSTGVRAAKAVFEGLIDYTISNRDIFVDGKLKGLGEPLIWNGQDKLNAVTANLDTIDVKIQNCLMIGNGKDDIPLLKAAGYKIVSPRACDEVLAMKGTIELRA